MPRRDSTPPLIPPDFEDKLTTISRQDSVDSAKHLEIASLKRQIRDLQATETRLLWDHAQLSQELKTCKSGLTKEKQEARTFAGKLSKESRNSNALGKEMVTLRENSERKVRDIEIKLEQERKKRAKNQQDAEKTIAGLHSQLDAKQSVIKELEARVPDKKRHLHATQAGIKVTRGIAHDPPSGSLACNSHNDEPSPVRTTLVPQLYNTIKYLQKENARLQSRHHEDGCEQYRTLIFQQLEDAKALHAAAEAETEGLHHLARANAELMEERAIDVKCIKELMGYRYRTEAEQPGEPVGELCVQQPIAFSVDQGTEVVIAPEDSKAEVAEYMQHLRAVELEVESLTLQRDSLLFERAEMMAQEQRSKPVLDLSAVLCLASEPELASPSKSSLTFSDLQTVSITPCVLFSASNPFTNPSLRVELEKLGKSIMSLSTMPPPKAVTKPAKLQATPLPNVALTINIQPTDKRNYSLLQRMQRAISVTSSLDIHGPKEVVKQFVASMHAVETDHAEKSKLVIQLDKAAEQHRANMKALESQLRDKRKCADAEHRMLADELEAKNVQFAMQEQLLTGRQRRNF